jgi:hypothetical protein
MENENQELLNFLYSFEKEKDIKLIYVCESASRAYGVEVEESDFDLKGLYLPNPKDSLRIMPKIETCFKIPHYRIIKDSKEYDVDVEFLDFREFAVMKKSSVAYFDFFLFSPTVYINKFPDIIEEIKSNLKPMPNEFLYRFRNMHQACVKTYEKTQDCMNKKLLGTLIHGVQYVHIYYFKNFPFFNIFEQIEFLKGKINDLGLEKPEVNLLLEIFNLVNYYYKEKKKGRKSVSETISDYQFRLNDFLEKINKMEKDVVYKYSIELDLFQDLLDRILNKKLFE